MIRIDHAALSWLKRTPEPIGQNARWLELLDEYDFDVQHRPGAMSRHPCLNRLSRKRKQTDVETDRPALFGGPANHPTIFSENVSKLQRTYVNLKRLLTLLGQGSEKPPWSEVEELLSAEAKTLWNEWEHLAIRGNVLCQKWESA